MAKFNFNLKDASASYSRIILIVRHNNEKLTFPTGESISPKYWNPTEQRAKQTREFPQNPEFNRRLNNIRARAEELFIKFNNDYGRPPSTLEFREILKQEFTKDPKMGKMTFFQFVEKHIQEASSRTNDHTGKPIAIGTILAYKNTLRLIREFQAKTKYYVDFETINLNFYYEFCDFLTGTQGFSVNTIGKHIKTIKLFLNSATDREMNKNLAYKSSRFKVVGEDVDSIYLNERELNDMFSLDLSTNKRLEKARDLFLIGCWTGLRFSDYVRLSAINIKNGVIKIETQKTRETVSIPIHPVVAKIIEKYSVGEVTMLPPPISNVNLNKYLKEIAEMIPCLHEEIPISKTFGGKHVHIKRKKYEMVTTHTARRSFATNLYLSGFPSISIKKITGHRTESAFLSYIKIDHNENAKLLEIHWQEKNQLMVV